MNSEVEDVDEKMISMLSKCHQFMSDQKLLTDTLSDGFILMKKSKVNGNSTLLGVEDIREDIEPSVTCKELETHSHSTTSNEEIFIFSALPSQNLRKSQNKFISSLLIIKRLSESAKSILEDVEDINKKMSIE